MTTNVTTTTASSQGDVPLQPPYAPLIVNYTNDNKIAGSEGSGSNDNSESNGDDSWDRDNDDVPTNPTTAPNARRKTNQAAIKEYGGHNVRARASQRDMPTTVY